MNGNKDDDMSAVTQAIPFASSLRARTYSGGHPPAMTRATLDAMQDAVITVDMQGNIDYANPAALGLLQMGNDELLGKPFSLMVRIENDHEPITADEFTRRCHAGHSIYDPESQLLLHRADGSEVPIEDFAAPIRLPDGRVMGGVMVFKDVSERRRVQDVLDLSGKMFRELLDFAPDAILIADLSGNIMLANARAEQMFGYEHGGIAGLEMQALIPQCLSCGNFAMSGEARAFPCQQDAIALEATCCSRDGEEFPGEVSLGLLDTAQGELLMAVVRDVSQRKHYEQQLYYQATHDLLTGLPNRAYLLDQLQQAMAQASRDGASVALLFVDLDNFKDVNDTLGHAVGDLLLLEMAARLRAGIPDSGLLARVSGDEFAIVLQGVASRAEVEQVASMALRAIVQPCDINGFRIHVSGSLGISIYPDDGDEALGLLRNADMAMYRAKEQGRNNYSMYSHEMHQGQQERMELSNALRSALEKREFELHYQPKLDLHSGQVHSLEALIRWRHPQKGMISPAFFIPLAEDCGLIVEIGAWVIDEACRQIAEWQDMGMRQVRIAVNLSAGQCSKDDIFTRIMNSLKAYDVDPHLLEVEITESMVLHDPVQALHTFNALRDQGVSIAIDDFGTGYSSFSYLKKFPSHCLKIDKSFVDDIAVDASNIEIIRAIIAVAHNMGMRVVAEGVETLEQLELLNKNGCNEIQGYYISPPLAAEDIYDFMKKFSSPV